MSYRRAWVACCATAVLLVCASAAAQRPGTSEESVKAAFLYNFTKFVDWPETAFTQPSAPFVVCAFADPGFRKALESILTNEQVRGRPITIAAPQLEDIRGCHLAYFGPADPERQARLLDAAKRAPVLTVGEGRRFLDQGGLIAFMLENDRVRFAISKRGADAAGLNVSSKLLRVARDFDGRVQP
jgi:hypothetical protein